jgi:L-aspartate oxidase
MTTAAAPLTWRADIAVVGSGLAGLAVALSAAEAGASVLLLTKSRLASGSSPWARGGVAAAVGAGDSVAEHARDTLAVARGIADSAAVERLTAGGPLAVELLLEQGARLDRDQDGGLARGREAGHSHRRILHAGGDRTGAELVRVLIEQVRQQPGVRVEEDVFALELVRGRGGRVAGISAIRDGRAILVLAPQIVLATGGAGQLFQYTTNPPEVTGDGIAMAARAGALLADLEFVQFHPTALLAPGNGALPLLTEALRGDGASLVDEQGRRFMPAVDPAAELAPRDVVARELWLRAERGEASYLDLRSLAAGDPEAFERRFPSAVEAALALGLDPARSPLPVTPAAHYSMGGVWVDAEGRTTLPGLWACGETASSGVHGANRLASNSLLEGLVFGRAVGRAAALARAGAVASLDPEEVLALVPTCCLTPAIDEEARAALRRALWRHAGPVRNAVGLRSLIEELRGLAQTGGVESSGVENRPADHFGSCDHELRNLLLLGRLTAAAALRRTESRGGHYRTDYPAPDAAWERRSLYRATDLVPGLLLPGFAGASSAPLLASAGATLVRADEVSRAAR